MQPTVDPEILQASSEMERIGNRAVRRAIEENRRLGIPNAFSFRGRIVYELPDGTLTEEDPFVPPSPTGDSA